MKEIGFYLDNILKNTKSKNLVFNTLIKIIKDSTGVVLEKENISIKNKIIVLKTKPLIKQKILIKKSLILEKINDFKYLFEDIV